MNCELWLVFYAHWHEEHQHLVLWIVVGRTDYAGTACVGHFNPERLAVQDAFNLEQEGSAEADADGVACVFAKDIFLGTGRVIVVLTGQLDVVVAQLDLDEAAALVAEDADALQGAD